MQNNTGQPEVASAAPTTRPTIHAMDVATVAADVATDPVTGLTSAEAATRLERDGPNELTQVPPKTWMRRIGEQFASPLVILLLVALVISLAAWWLEDEGGAPYDAIAIAAIVILNAGIGAFQEHRAEGAVAALQRLTSAEAGVVRDGLACRVPAREIVVGDVLVVEEGDAIAADGRLVETATLAVSEASLTGESEPVRKGIEAVETAAPLGDRTSMVFAGTAAVTGRGKAIVTGTGMQAEIGQIATLLHETEREPTPLERELAGIGRFLGIAVIIIAIVVMATTVALSDIESSRDLVEVLLIGVSLAVAAVPEGLPAVLSIVLAIGVQRMATRRALVKRLPSAETLGAATVICTDKTGTLTLSQMTVRALLTADGLTDLPEGQVDEHGRDALVAGARASNATIELDDSGWRSIGDPTEGAIVAAATAVAPDGALTAPRLAELPFSSDRKRMSVLVESEAGLRVLAKGAPEVIIDRCIAERTTTGDRPLDDQRRAWWAGEVEGLADRAMRTLAIAERTTDRPTLDDEDEWDLTLLGVVGIVDPPRDEAAPAVAAALSAGIRVIMITGDHPRTAAQIARDVGIASGEIDVVEGTTIEELDDDALIDVAANTAVFARVAPAHKLRLVQALRARGEVVAMTGDGVNDAPALKAADIGTAMGVTGTDVAREASDMVLTDDNFATIIAAVSEGRGIFHNVRSFLRYLLSSNIGEVLTMLGGVVLATVIGLKATGDAVIAPITAAQILWINLLTDTGPALALGVDPAGPKLMQRRPRRSTDRAIDRPMQRGIGVIGLTMAVATLAMLDAKLPGGLISGSGDLDTARTGAFTVLVLAQLFNCFNARSDSVSAFVGWAANRWLLGAVALSLALQFAVVYAPPLQTAFETTSLSVTDWLLSAVLASSILWVSEIRKLIERRADPTAV